MRGAERNQPCPCGSGLKAKRCEHSTRSPYEGVRVVRVDGEPRQRVGHVAHRSPLALTAIASMLAVPPVRR